MPYRYGVTLVGVRQDIPGATIQLNPGPHHTMKTSDVCFYMSITKEENSQFILAHPNDDRMGVELTGAGSGGGGRIGVFGRHGSLKDALARAGSYRYSKVTGIIATVGGRLFS